MTRTPLPIDPTLPELIAALRDAPAVVLQAPPGAGKTTRVPPALLDAGLAGSNQIVMLEPRRLAARAAAARMATERGERVGGTVGYQVRFERKASKDTRILVLTEGILTRRLVGDPFLEGIGVVILDEFHERSVHTDLALAFLRQVQEVRDDLKLVVMSATLRAEELARYLGDCPVVTAEGRLHELVVEHVDQDDQRDLTARTGAGLRRLLEEAPAGGDVLAFLPGAPEIRRVERHLRDHPLPGAPEVLPLYGALPPQAQDRVLRAGKKRRVVLATNLAETSLTVPGVTAVLDTGLRKVMRHDRRIGLDRLERVKISQHSATQRAGRAGRTAPGRVLRLWTKAEHPALAVADEPELTRVDLAPVLLQVLAFAPGDPLEFNWLDAPGDVALDTGLDLLRMLGALPPSGYLITVSGSRLAALPVHPRVGVLLEAAQEAGLLAEGALLAALLGEGEIVRLSPPSCLAVPVPTVDSDLLWRAELFAEVEKTGFRETRIRSHEPQDLNHGAVRRVARARDQILRTARRLGPASQSAPPQDVKHGAPPQGVKHGAPMQEAAHSAPPHAATHNDWPSADTREASLCRCVLAGFPDRVCRRREPGKPGAVMVGGRGVELHEASGVRDAELFVALEADAGKRGTHAVSRVRQASAVTLEDLEACLPHLLHTTEGAVFDPERRSVVGARRTLLADLELGRTEGVTVDPAVVAATLAEEAARRLAEWFKPDRDTQALLDRLRFAAQALPEEDWPDVTESGLKTRLPDLCLGRHRLAELSKLDWRNELLGRLDYKLRQLLDREVPERIAVPSGSKIRLDYRPALLPDGAPVLAVQLQQVFGLADTPRIARNRVRVRLHLLAPNQRPAQVTEDLKSFWKNTYPEVRKELRARYAKHAWPEDPWNAQPERRPQRRKR